MYLEMRKRVSSKQSVGQTYGDLYCKDVYREKSITYGIFNCFKCGSKDNKINLDNVKRGRQSTCGCKYDPNTAIGQRFEKLTCIHLTKKDKWGTQNAKFACDCGNTVERSLYDVRTGHTSSCGCIRKPHGMTGTKEHNAWTMMLMRCNNPNNEMYPSYGGRGITVHSEWEDNFVSFFDYIGLSPTPEHSLDRIDVNGNYEPGNVRWSTQDIQSMNKRNTWEADQIQLLVELKTLGHTYRRIAEVLNDKFGTNRTMKSVETKYARHTKNASTPVGSPKSYE